eukprot:12904203-Prorocentrum_lima.AAC.1
MFKAACFYLCVFPVVLLEGCEEEADFGINSSTFDVVDVRGDEAYQLRMEATVRASDRFGVLVELSPDMAVNDSLL